MAAYREGAGEPTAVRQIYKTNISHGLRLVSTYELQNDSAEYNMSSLHRILTTIRQDPSRVK